MEGSEATFVIYCTPDFVMHPAGTSLNCSGISIAGKTSILVSMANHQFVGNSVNKNSKSDVAVVMVPVPAQGHLNQLLHLSRIISSYELPVYFVSTEVHNRQAKIRAAGWDPLAISNLHFYDLPFPDFDAPLPDPSSRDRFPAHLQSLIAAIYPLRNNIFALIRDLAKTSRRVVVILDFGILWMIQDVSFIPKAESYCFHTISAFDLHYLVRQFEEKSVLSHGEPVKDLPPIDRAFGPDYLIDYFAEHLNAKKWNHGNIYNTSRAIEGQFLDLLTKDRLTNTDKHWAVGPFNPVSLPARKTENEYLEWLDKQGQKSVIFVSFGTTTSLPNDQVKEIALGLERSGQKFMWVLRYADRVDDFDREDRKAQLPEGFEERVEGRGIIVLGWAPQLEILAHPSTGGFLSHCGWSSCMESISMGVPLATWPMHSDQALNAILITRVLKIGLPVRECTIQIDELVKSEMVEEAVKRLMASAEGDELRKRAEELSNAVKQSVSKDGDSAGERACFIAHITR